MATTTNFGWETPDDTDLVKDGAAAMRTLGNSIDTSFVDLKGGTTGQVLSKASGTDLDFTWVAQDDSNAIQNAIVDAKGDLITATGADTPARLAVGTNGQVLTADSTTSTGLKWAAAAASAGLDLITTNTFSAVSAVNLNDIFTSTYTNYKVIINANASSDVAFRWRLRASGTDNTSSNYLWGLNGIQYTGQSAYNESINGSLDSAFKTGAIGSNYRTILTMDIQNPQATDYTGYLGSQIYPASSTNAYAYNVTGVASVTTSYDGMSFYPSSGTISGSYWIYGYKKA